MNDNNTSPKQKNAANEINTTVVVTPEQPNTNKTKAKKKTTTNHGPFSIRVQNKSGVKYLRDMTSPSSTFAAVNNYKSILDALYAKHYGEHGVCPDFRTMVFQHFGGCHMFRTDFEAHVTKSASIYFQNETPTSSVLENSFHKSVRHMCDRACFLRAYSPIRELSFLYRDLIIDENTVDERGLTTAQVLDGWMCQLVPPAPAVSLESSPIDTDDIISTKTKPTKQSKAPSICATIFVSPKGQEFDKRAKLEKHLNVTYFETSRDLIQLPTTATILQTNPLSDCMTSINPLFTPLGLLEELFTDDPWKLLVSTILLNKTQRQQVDVVMFHFLQKWPDAHSTTEADSNEILNIIGPLGLGNKRSKSLIRFSEEYLRLIETKHSLLPNESDLKLVEFSFSREDIVSLHQCGEYAWSAYELFILKELPKEDAFQVCDHALKLYVEYKLGLLVQKRSTEKVRVSKRKAALLNENDTDKTCTSVGKKKRSGAKKKEKKKRKSAKKRRE